MTRRFIVEKDSAENKKAGRVDLPTPAQLDFEKHGYFICFTFSQRFVLALLSTASVT